MKNKFFKQPKAQKMKKLFLPGLFFMLSGFLLAGTDEIKENLAASEHSFVKTEVEVYYFHRNRRCGPCRTIENLARKTMDTYYIQEMQSGDVIFHIVNVEQDENREVAQKFSVVSTALFMNVKNETEENATNLTAFAYRHSRNEEAFMSGLKEQIDAALGK